MYLKQETLDNISKTIERKLGIPYEEFDKLDFDEQQRLISEYKKSQKRKNDDKTIDFTKSHLLEYYYGADVVNGTETCLRKFKLCN